MSDPILEIYREMILIGYKLDPFKTWEKRVQLFYAAKTGGLVFVADEKEPSIWWLNVYCPNDRPPDNTVRFLMVLAFTAGCKKIVSKIKRAGAGRLLERVGFYKNGDLYYCEA